MVTCSNELQNVIGAVGGPDNSVRKWGGQRVSPVAQQVSVWDMD